MTMEIICVCICTYRRPALKQALASIAAQQLPVGIGLRVVVADNDSADTKRSAVEADGQALGLDLTYVHAPERNISVARNACLDVAASDWIAFVDDDEVAAPDWIASLVRERSGHDIVFGVSQALYSDPRTPQWVVEGDFHSNRIEGNDDLWNGYTANVLIDRRFIASKGLRFAAELGKIGGEDTLFFFEAHLAGANFGYAPGSIVYEETVIARAGFRWLALRRFRSGQVHHMLLLRQGAGRYAGLQALPKALICFVQAAALLPWRVRAMRSALRGLLHAGVVASTFGIAPYQEYGT
jgi:succinoglycan biosynthesis protein ExoM